MDKPKQFPGSLLKFDSTPFAQPSPPPRRKPHLGSDQSKRRWRSEKSADPRRLISPPIQRPSPAQLHQLQKLESKQSLPDLVQPVHSHRKPRSKIPFQWRLPSTSSHSSQPKPIKAQAKDPLDQRHGPSRLNPLDHPSIPQPPYRPLAPQERHHHHHQPPLDVLPGLGNLTTNHPASSDDLHSSSVSSSSSSSKASLSSYSASRLISRLSRGRDPNSKDSSHSITPRSSSSRIPSISSAHSDDVCISTLFHHTRPSSPTAARSDISSSASSFHPSSDYTSESELGSLQDDHEEVLSSSPHPQLVSLISSARPSTRSSSPRPSTPTSNSLPPPATCYSASSVEVSGPARDRGLPQSPSSLAESSSSSSYLSHTPSSSGELPFARPSPSMSNDRVRKRPGRPTPALAPHLPRSRTPSLVIRPRLSLASNQDSTSRTMSSYCSSAVHVPETSPQDHVGDDVKERPLSLPPKTDQMRTLGWGRTPIDTPRLISLQSSLPHTASPCPPPNHRTPRDALIADYLLTPNRPHERLRPKTSPVGPAPTPARNISKSKRFKDRFTLANTAPLKIYKKHHSQAPPGSSSSTTDNTSRRIVSGLLGALSPTGLKHPNRDDPSNERRKADFKKMISYPVLDVATDKDSSPILDDEDPSSDTDLDCYNLSIEAAVRSLEGISSHDGFTRIKTCGFPKRSSSAFRDDQSTIPMSLPGPQLVGAPQDPSTANLSEDCSFTSDRAEIWRQKLRRRVSINRLMKSRHKQVGSSPNVDYEEADPRNGQFVDVTPSKSKVIQNHLRRRASARLRPLLRKVSSVSLRQRAWASETEGSALFATKKLDGTVCEENEQEELLIPGDNPVRRSTTGPCVEIKSEGRFRWYRLSHNKNQPPHSAHSSDVMLNTPKGRQAIGPFIVTGQSIREKRRVFEQRGNQSTDSFVHLPTSSASSLAGSVSSSLHSPLTRAASSKFRNSVRSSVSRERPPKRKPTPAEIKLRDETQSVKALVDKFETQNKPNSFCRSIDSDRAADRGSGRTSKAGKVGSTGLIRSSLLSLWSGAGSTASSRKFDDVRRLSQRRGRSSGHNLTDTEVGAQESDVNFIKKLKKKRRKKSHDDDSSISSFGCDPQEFDEDQDQAGVKTCYQGDRSRLGKRLDDRNSLIFSSPSRPRKRSTWSDSSSVRAHVLKGEKLHNGPTRLSFILGSPNTNVCQTFDRSLFQTQSRPVISDQSQALGGKASFDQDDSTVDRTWSPLSSEQAHKAPTILEPQTVSMVDGSEMRILVAGGRLQVAKKIPFPTFEDDAEFSQAENILPESSSTEPLPCKVVSSTEPLPCKVVAKPAGKSTSTRIGSFLRTRQFEEEVDDEDFEEDEPLNRSMLINSHHHQEAHVDGGMMSDIGMACLLDSPTHGRGRSSLQRSTLSAPSRGGSFTMSGQRSMTSSFVLDRPPGMGDHTTSWSNSPGGTPDSQEIRKVYLSVERCEGVGNKMFGSSIQSWRSPTTRSPVTRRSHSTIIPNKNLLHLSPAMSDRGLSNTRPQSQPPTSSFTANAIIESFQYLSAANVCQRRSPLASISSGSSSQQCERFDRPKDENLTTLTDIDCIGKNGASEISPTSSRPSSFPQDHKTNAKGNIVDKPPQVHPPPLPSSTPEPVVNEDLEFELNRLQCVQERWKRFCLEVEDELRKSREKWPDLDQSNSVLEEFMRPTTKSAIESFLTKSQNLYRESVAAVTHQFSRYASENQVFRMTPPPKHPFGSPTLTPTRLSEQQLRDLNHDLGAQFTSFMTPPQVQLARNGQAQVSFPLVVTLPVPSAFVSPERFLSARNTPEIASEHPPRVLKVSNASWRSAPRQPTLSNHFGGPSVRLVAARNRRVRMMSVNSNGSVQSIGKGGVLGEISVNQSPGPGRNPISTINEKPGSSPKIFDRPIPTSATGGSLGRANRLSNAKRDSENEGFSWSAASLRETRKPWRRSIFKSNHLNTGTRQDTIQTEGRDSLPSSKSSSNQTTEEVGVLVAAGEQPSGFSDALHMTGSLRLKHMRRLNQTRSDRSIGKGSKRASPKTTRTETESKSLLSSIR